MYLNISNSFTTVIDAAPQVLQLIQALTTYENDHSSELGQLFYQLKLAKRTNNRKLYFMTKARIEFLESTKVVCLFKNGKFPTGLLNVVRAGLDDFRANYTIRDLRIEPESNVILRWNEKPFEPRYYQKEMIEAGLKAGRGVFEACVGSGKTLILGYLIKELSVTSLIIVPSVALSGQIYNEMARWFGPGKIECLDAKKVRAMKRPKPISIITVQSLASLQKTGDIQKLIQHIDAVFCDEVHHAGAASFSNLLGDLENVYFRYGFSATFQRNDSKTLEMWSFLSNVIGEYPAHKAIADGFLTPLTAVIHSLDGKSYKKFQKEYDAHYLGNGQLLQKIVDIIENANSEDSILILVSRKDKGGAVIKEYLETLGIPAVFLSGDDSKDVLTKGIQSFNDQEFRVLIGSSVLSEGVDVRSATHLINCVGLKSEITLVQAVGRCVRLFPGKTHAYVHDFNFEGAKFMERHLKLRTETYIDSFGANIVDGN